MAGTAAELPEPTVLAHAKRRLFPEGDDEAVDGAVLTYPNRLSALLFMMARSVNERTDVGNEDPTYDSTPPEDTSRTRG